MIAERTINQHSKLTFFLTKSFEDLIVKYLFQLIYTKGRFTLHNVCLKLSHATCLQLELHCVNQAHNSPTLSQTSCVLDLPSTIQVVNRLHVTVLRPVYTGDFCCDFLLLEDAKE